MLKLRQLVMAIILCTTLLVSCALAQTTLTQILDIITNPDGTPFNGTVIITWNGYSGTGTGTISRLSASAMVYNGALSVLLVPTTTAAAGTYYDVVYNSSDGTVSWTEVWQVPPSTTPLTLSQVRQSSTEGSAGPGTGPISGTQYATLPIAISQVTSLSADLSTMNSSLSALTSQVTTLATQVGSINLTNIQAQVTSLATTVSGLGTTVTGNSSELTALTATVSGLNSAVTSLTNTVNGISATINSLTANGSSAVFVDDETPTGIIDGTNATFALSHTPAPAGSLFLFRNGLAQATGVDFSISGSVVSFATASTPKPGDVLLSYYRIAGIGTPINFTDSETPGGTINGTNLGFTLATTPNPAASLKLYKNGLLLQQGGDYTVSGATVTFTSTASGPAPGDSLMASYRH